MAKVYLGLGSNLGDRALNLRIALERLAGPSLQILRSSSLYETAPVGLTPEPVPDYLNLVVEVETKLSPAELLEHTQRIEQAGGRVSSFLWGPRRIESHILFFEGAALGAAN